MELENLLTSIPAGLNEVASVAAGMWLMRQRLYERLRQIRDRVFEVHKGLWENDSEFLIRIFAFPPIDVSATPGRVNDLQGIRITRTASDVDVFVYWEVRDFNVPLLGGEKRQTSGSLWMVMNHSGGFAEANAMALYSSKFPGEKPDDVFAQLPVVFNNKTDGAQLRARVNSRILGEKLLKLQDLLECIKQIEPDLQLQDLSLHERNHPRPHSQSRSKVRKNSKANRPRL